jgi:hypothetical protein
MASVPAYDKMTRFRVFPFTHCCCFLCFGFENRSEKSRLFLLFMAWGQIVLLGSRMENGVAVTQNDPESGSVHFSITATASRDALLAAQSLRIRRRWRERRVGRKSRAVVVGDNRVSRRRQSEKTTPLHDPTLKLEEYFILGLDTWKPNYYGILGLDAKT